MKYRIIAPHKLLSPYVRYFSALDYQSTENASSQIRVFADRYPHLVFQHHNGQSAFYKNGDALPTSFLSGVKIDPYICDVFNHSVVTVTFYPQAVSLLFGIDVHELNNEVVDMRNFTSADLNCRLMYASGYQERIGILTDYLLNKIARSKATPDFLVAESMQLINDLDVETSITSLTQHFKISKRQLERRFKSGTGLAPKLFLRVARFENAVKLIKENNFGSLSNLAFYLNYTDHSHFVKDFKEFSGFTPTIFTNHSMKTEKIIPDNKIVTINHLLIER